MVIWTKSCFIWYGLHVSNVYHGNVSWCVIKGVIFCAAHHAAYSKIYFSWSSDYIIECNFFCNFGVTYCYVFYCIRYKWRTFTRKIWILMTDSAQRYNVLHWQLYEFFHAKPVIHNSLYVIKKLYGCLKK